VYGPGAVTAALRLNCCDSEPFRVRFLGKEPSMAGAEPETSEDKARCNSSLVKFVAARVKGTARTGI